MSSRRYGGGHVSSTTPMTELPMAPLGPAPGALPATAYLSTETRARIGLPPFAEVVAEEYLAGDLTKDEAMALLESDIRRGELLDGGDTWWASFETADGTFVAPMTAAGAAWKQRMKDDAAKRAAYEKVAVEWRKLRAECERQRTRLPAKVARFWVRFGRGWALHGAAFGQVLVVLVVLGLAATLAIWVF